MGRVKELKNEANSYEEDGKKAEKLGMLQEASDFYGKAAYTYGKLSDIYYKRLGVAAVLAVISFVIFLVSLAH